MSTPSKPDPQYEYRVVASSNEGVEVQFQAADPAGAGAIYRGLRGLLPSVGGGSVEIQRRPVGEWETAGRAEVPVPGPGMSDVSGMEMVATGDPPPHGVSFSGTVQSGGTVTIRGYALGEAVDEEASAMVAMAREPCKVEIWSGPPPARRAEKEPQ